MISISYLKLLCIPDNGKLSLPTATKKMAMILHRIDLPIKIVDLKFPSGIYTFENISYFNPHHRLKA